MSTHVASTTEHGLLTGVWQPLSPLIGLLIATLGLLGSLCASWQTVLSSSQAPWLTHELATIDWLEVHAAPHALMALMLAWAGWQALRHCHHETELARWRRRSCLDPLTGVANRRGLRRHLRVQTRNSGELVDVSVIVIDLDNFKTLNDRHGHKAGDQALRHMATLLKKRFRRRDDWLISRLGGDEFMIVMSHTSPTYARRVARSLARRIALTSIFIDGKKIYFGASIGQAVGQSCHPTAIFRLAAQADAKLLSKKRSRS